MINKGFILLIGLIFVFQSCFCQNHKIKKYGAFYSFNLFKPTILLHNNEFAELMYKKNTELDGNFAFFKNLNRRENIAIGIVLGVYKHYSDVDKKEVVNLLNKYGESYFGDIVYNDWVEYRLGAHLDKIFFNEKRISLMCELGGGTVFGVRSRQVYKTSDNSYIYAHVPKGKMGNYFSSKIELQFKFKKDVKSSIGLSVGYIYGKYPVSYEIRYGQEGNDVYNSYNYLNKFILSRFNLGLGFNIYFSDMKLKR